MAIEIPNYKVIKKENNIELREYQSYVIANVKVAADNYGSAGSHGFGPLADYIFGNNTKRNKIKMTAPVSTEQSEQIPMTAPVDTSKSGNYYKVSFTMPSNYSMTNIPTPNNKDISLEEVPKHKAVVLSFSGYTADKKVESKIEDLKNWANKNNIAIKGGAVLSRYDSPWKPGFIRRNEVSFRVN